MRKRRATGRPSRLSADQIQEIRKMYEQGARAWGFPSDRWTTGRLAEAIERGFGIRYDCDHVGRLMHKFGLREKRREALQARARRAVDVAPVSDFTGFRTESPSA